MIKAFLSSKSSTRINNKQFLKEVKSERVHFNDHLISDMFTQPGASPHREVLIEVREGLIPGKRGVSRGAKDLEDAEELVHFGVPGEERLLEEKFGEDAAHAPHVQAAGVLVKSEHQFGGAVPQRQDLLRVGSDGNGVDAAQPEVGDFCDEGLVADEDVLGFEVSVQNFFGVQVVRRLENLVHDGLYRLQVVNFGVVPEGVDVLPQVEGAVLQAQFYLLIAQCDVLNPHYVRVIYLL